MFKGNDNVGASILAAAVGDSSVTVTLGDGSPYEGNNVSEGAFSSASGLNAVNQNTGINSVNQQSIVVSVGDVAL